MGMVFTMDGDPLLGDHACGQPQPESKKVTDDWIQSKRSVCLMAMQEDGNCGNGNMG
jgi:hypothetical protein